MKPRELRHRVVLPAFVRESSGWSNGCILNVSSRGLLLHSKSPAAKGNMVELCYGGHVIIARVMWRSGARLGLRSDDPLPVEDIAPLGQDSAFQLGAAERRQGERRKRPRTEEKSRHRARAMEFFCAVMIGATLATAAFVLVEQAFAAPLAAVRAALGN